MHEHIKLIGVAPCQVARSNKMDSLGCAHNWNSGVCTPIALDLSPLSMALQVRNPLSNDCKFSKSVSSEASVPCTHPVFSWTFHDICDWLHELQLQEYTDTFATHAITNGRTLLQLTQEHMKEMGISKIGHRVAVSNALDKLRSAAGMVPKALYLSAVEFIDR